MVPQLVRRSLNRGITEEGNKPERKKDMEVQELKILRLRSLLVIYHHDPKLLSYSLRNQDKHVNRNVKSSSEK